jgi:tRNA modification GTPase
MIEDTIAAIATARGFGGIGIIRISGKNADKVAKSIIKTIPKDRYALHTNFYNKENKIIDEGLAIFFKGPKSFTGEDVLELHSHGGPVILDVLLKEILSLGYVRHALPGEFTKRAFLNGKIDLTQAEAIIDLINASSEQAALSATNSLQGHFSELIKELNQQLINLRSYIEATIDFPDDNIDFIQDGKVIESLKTLIARIKEIFENAKQGVILQEGIKIVIAGKPNAGKSSLLNALCEKDCAIVTHIEGTTRDVLKENINIDGMPLHIIDTAGLRINTTDIVEQIGINRAWNEITQANRILFVIDSSTLHLPDNVNEQIKLFNLIKEKTNNAIPFTIIANKTDICKNFTLPEEWNSYPVIDISAKSFLGIDNLRKHLKDSAGFKNTTDGIFSARRRHLNALEQAKIHLERGLELTLYSNELELTAEEMRLAQDNLNEILGRFTSDDLLGNIFNTFCIGK